MKKKGPGRLATKASEPKVAMSYRLSPAKISRAQRILGTKTVDLMRQNKIDGWQGPAGPFVYLILRSDAVDVVYGTMEGYAALGIPYMPHIAPEKRW